MSVCANIAVKLARKIFNRKNLPKQDKPCVSAKVHKHHLDSNTFTSGNGDNLPEDYFEKNLLQEIGLEHETANLLNGCNLLKTGILKFKTNHFVTEKLPEEWKSIKIIDKGCYRIYDKALKKLLLPILKNHNRYIRSSYINRYINTKGSKNQNHKRKIVISG